MEGKPHAVGETLIINLDGCVQSVHVMDREVYKEGNVRYYLQTQDGKELYLSHDELERMRE